MENLQAVFTPIIASALKIGAVAAIVLLAYLVLR